MEMCGNNSFKVIISHRKGNVNIDYQFSEYIDYDIRNKTAEVLEDFNRDKAHCALDGKFKQELSSCLRCFYEQNRFKCESIVWVNLNPV